MKLLHIIRSVNPEGGGPIEGIKQLAQISLASGHSIEVASLDAPDAEFIKDVGLPVHALGPGLGNYGYCRGYKPWLSAHCRDYDAIVIDGIWQYHDYAAHDVLTRHDIPYFVFTHGMLDPWFNKHYPLKRLKKMMYWSWGQYPVLRDACKVLFTCEEEKILARESFRPYRCEEHAVGFGTLGFKGCGNASKQSFFDRFPELLGKRLILFLSRIHPKKGVDLLLKAFKPFSLSCPDLRLVIAGPDQLGWQSELQSLSQALGIADRVVWPGMLTGDVKWGAFLASEIFILPSHQENFGIVVAEALSCGKPVLISNKVNIWREVEQDGAGFIADDTVEGTALNLERWFQLAPECRSLMAENASRCFNDRFHAKSAAERLIKVIGEGRA